MVVGFQLNAFNMAPVVGMQDLTSAPSSVISGIIDSSYAGAPFAAGTPVKLVTTSNGIPKVVPVTSDSDDVFGIALYSTKNGFYALTGTVNQALEIGMKDAVVYMNSAGAIMARQGVATQIGNATPGSVVAAAGSANRIGFALDAATGPNQLIRVYLESPTAASGLNSRTTTVVATLAQINAGMVLIPGSAGRQITVTNFVERVAGTFTGGTSVSLLSDATAVNVETTAEAGLTSGAVLTPSSANVTLGAGFSAALPAGEGLKVASVGTQAGGTSITYTITYTQG